MIHVIVAMMTNAKHMVLSHIDDNFFFFGAGILYFPKEFTCDKAKELMISIHSYMIPYDLLLVVIYIH